jgi:hypothetical protein
MTGEQLQKVELMLCRSLQRAGRCDDTAKIETGQAASDVLGGTTTKAVIPVSENRLPRGVGNQGKGSRLFLLQKP